MLQFSRRDDLQNTGIDPAIENRRIVWTFIFEAAGNKAEGNITNNRCNFFLNACSEIRRISEQDVLPKRSADNITRSYFRHYLLHRIFVELLSSKPSKSSASLTILFRYHVMLKDYCSTFI